MYRHARRSGIELHDEFKERYGNNAHMPCMLICYRYCSHCYTAFIPTITTSSISVHRGKRKHGSVCVEYTCSACNGKTTVDCGRVDPDVKEVILALRFRYDIAFSVYEGFTSRACDGVVLLSLR